MLLLKNATVIPGDETTCIEHGNVLVNGARILAVTDHLDSAQSIDCESVDCTGKVVMPGLITHHTHGLVNGPFLASGAPPLAEDAIIAQHKRHLMNGHTTALNVDGFCTMEEVRNSARYSPLRVKQAAVQLPLSFRAADMSDARGLQKVHRETTLEQMFAGGAVAIGEVGAGQTTAGGDYVYIPAEVKAQTGVSITAAQSMALLLGVLGKWADKNYYDRDRVAAMLQEQGLSQVLTPEQARDIVWKTTFRVYDDAVAAYEEAAAAGIRYGMPVIVHNTPSVQRTMEKLVKMGVRNLICAHSSLMYTPEEAAAAAASYRKNYGVLIDAASMDSYGARVIDPSTETLMALLRHGLVDLLSTDYAGGNSDSMLNIIQEAVQRGILTLPKAVSLATTRPAQAIPGLAVGTGYLAPHYLADILVTDGQDVSKLERVYVGGRLVVDHGTYLPEKER